MLIAAFALLSACSITSGASHEETTGTRADTAPATSRPPVKTHDAPARLGAAELQGRWWTWAASSVTSSNPVADPDGHLCAEHQPTDIWFLAGSFGEKVKRSCAMPAAVPVAFPLVNIIGEAADCDAFMASAQGSATLDGRALKPERHEATTVSVNALDGNPVTGTRGYFRTVACGLWVQLDPLSPGSHELKIRGSSEDFAISVDYKLRVSNS